MGFWVTSLFGLFSSTSLLLLYARNDLKLFSSCASEKICEAAELEVNCRVSQSTNPVLYSIYTVWCHKRFYPFLVKVNLLNTQMH